MKTTLYFVAQAGFIVLSAVYLTLLVREIRKGLAAASFPDQKKKQIVTRIVIGLIVWALVISVWSLSGTMGNFSLFPLNMAPVIILPLIIIPLLVFSRAAKEIFIHIPLANIIRLQSFRFFVEILLWLLFVDNLLPVQMTFEGRNFDILSGITAPVVAYFASKPHVSRAFLIVWNFICLGLLINIVTVAILSMPVPFRVFMNEPSNTIVAQFPISWLPAILVPLAYTLQFISLRQAFMRPAK